MVALGFFSPGPQPPNRPVRGRLRVLRTGRWWIAAALPFALICGFVTVAVTADDKCKSPDWSIGCRDEARLLLFGLQVHEAGT